MKYYVFNPLAKNKEKYTYTKNHFNLTKSCRMKELAQCLVKGDTIIIIGGDGTLNYALNKYPFLLKYFIKYYPNGSGNDFFRSLKHQTNSYVYYLNDKYLFINSFGIGFDALICQKVEEGRKKSKLAYFLNAYRGIKEYQPIEVELTYNNTTRKFKHVWLCGLHNGAYFGGGIKIAKNANINESKLQLCIAHNLNRVSVLFLLIFVKLNLIHLFKSYFTIIETDNLVIKLSQETLAELDGEVLKLPKHIYLSDYRIINISALDTLE